MTRLFPNQMYTGAHVCRFSHVHVQGICNRVCLCVCLSDRILPFESLWNIFTVCNSYRLRIRVMFVHTSICHSAPGGGMCGSGMGACIVPDCVCGEIIHGRVHVWYNGHPWLWGCVVGGMSCQAWLSTSADGKQLNLLELVILILNMYFYNIWTKVKYQGHWIKFNVKWAKLFNCFFHMIVTYTSYMPVIHWNLLQRLGLY